MLILILTRFDFYFLLVWCSFCKMHCLSFQLMLGSECVSDVRLPHLHSESCRVYRHQRTRRPPARRQKSIPECQRLLWPLRPIRATDTQSMDEPVRRNFLTSQQNIWRQIIRFELTVNTLNVSGLSENNTQRVYSSSPHTAVLRTFKVPRFLKELNCEGFNE